MFMQSFVGSVQVYSSKIVFGHWKSIMATRLGSMARSVMALGVMLKVASSMRMDMAVRVSLRFFASAILSLNKCCVLLWLVLCYVSVILILLVCVCVLGVDIGLIGS